MGRLDGKVALVTGGASGLGAADCRLFAAEGASVIVADVNPAGGAIAEEIGGRFMHLDVASEDNWQQVVDAIREEFGALHVLVNNAGIVEAGDILKQTLEQYRRVNAVCAEGTFIGCQRCIPLMIESGGGSIINMASIASLQGQHQVIAYCGAKAAVEAMTRAIAVWANQEKNNIRCNSIHPSQIDTPMIRGVGQKIRESGMERKSVPGKVGVPDDVAYMALYLASDESRFINGTAMVVDNGMRVTPGVVPA